MPVRLIRDADTVLYIYCIVSNSISLLYWSIRGYIYVYTCFLASSSEREKDVGRINEKQYLLAHLGDAVFTIICKQG